jgi:type III secretory pathway component EscU
VNILLIIDFFFRFKQNKINFFNNLKKELVIKSMKKVAHLAESVLKLDNKIAVVFFDFHNQHCKLNTTN